MAKKEYKDLLDIPQFLRDLSDKDPQVKTEVTEKKSKIAWPIEQSEPVQEVVEKPKSVKPKVDIQARMQAQTSEYLVDVKDIIDCTIEGIKVESVYDFCKEQNIPGAYCSKLIPECEALKSEYTISLEARHIKSEERTEEQQDLYEGFECYSMKEMKNFVAVHDQVISDLERWSKVKQGEKKARKPRAMSVERMIKKLQYKK